MIAARYSRYYTYIKPVIENKFVKSSAPYIFSLITITIFILFAIRPTISTILNLQKNIENHRQILEALEKKENDLTTGRNNLQSLDPERREKINAAIPENADVTSLIGSLRNASGKETLVSALQIQPVVLMDSEVTPQKTLLSLGEASFTYNIQGDYGQLLPTLYNLQRSPRLLSIGSVVLSSQGGVIVLSVSGKASFLK